MYGTPDAGMYAQQSPQQSLTSTTFCGREGRAGVAAGTPTVGADRRAVPASLP